jgi:hypothetical protein
MFTLVKVREGLAVNDYADPGHYQHPAGTVAHEVEVSATAPVRRSDGSANRPQAVVRAARPGGKTDQRPRR